jgi:hypothetical protein
VRQVWTGLLDAPCSGPLQVVGRSPGFMLANSWLVAALSRDQSVQSPWTVVDPFRLHSPDSPCNDFDFGQFTQ